MELYYLLFLIIGIALGAIGVYFAMRSQVLAAKERNASTEQQMRDQQDTFREQMKIMQESSQQQMRSQQESQQKQMEQQMALIREQMNSASEKILKERAEELSTVNKEQLSGILTPLQTHIQQMREAVERSDREHNSTMQRLDATIKTSIEQSRQVGERADKLAQALTGENKTQGNFGELRLKQLLEGMGLQEGEQFTLQETIRDKDGYVVYEEEGHRLIPDAILHFPDKRDVIIDSKMSFTAFEDYHNAETEAQRQDALKRHLTSMRNHVNELSRKNYSKYIAEGHAKLDFVLMYVFSESALQLALSNDATLWKDAYDRGVIITGSQNLYTMLRVLEMTWKQVRQVENQQKIMECANMIVDRAQLFAERFESGKQQLLKTQDSFDKLESITAETGQSILTPASRLLKMGASQNPKRKKQLQQEQALENTEEENTPA
jgi:DNA recombination protein RmuC